MRLIQKFILFRYLNNMTIGIYMITNKINNKKYIGQSINIKRRKSEHFSKKCDMVISKSIFKYGKKILILKF